MVYTATHITRHIYESPVSQCLNEMRLTPRSLPGQRVHQTDIRVQPETLFFRSRKDYFGNDVTTAAVFEPHDRFIAAATSIVEVLPPTGEEAASSLAWEEARDVLGAQPDDSCLQAIEFIFDSPYVSAGREFAEFAHPTFTPRRPLVEAVKELSHRIHDEFSYKPESTSIHMPLTEVLHNRQGVCQDFAHIMIASLRSLRLSARYVSGYLRSGAKFQGAEASHAWVSVFIPGSGWLSLDPTNDLLPTDGHVTLAWGRDYGDVTPVKGITIGGGDQIVEVEVRVRPLEI